MLVVHVHVHVKPESVEAFKQATIANVRESIKEPGIAGFEAYKADWLALIDSGLAERGSR